MAACLMRRREELLRPKDPHLEMMDNEMLLLLLHLHRRRLILGIILMVVVMLGWLCWVLFVACFAVLDGSIVSRCFLY
jgi:hypothetical protein